MEGTPWTSLVSTPPGRGQAAHHRHIWSDPRRRPQHRVPLTLASPVPLSFCLFITLPLIETYFYVSLEYVGTFSPLLPLSRSLRVLGTSSRNNWCLWVKAPGAPHLVTGLASWYMGSWSIWWGMRFNLTYVSPLTFPDVINYKIFHEKPTGKPPLPRRELLLTAPERPCFYGKSYR